MRKILLVFLLLWSFNSFSEYISNPQNENFKYIEAGLTEIKESQDTIYFNTQICSIDTMSYGFGKVIQDSLFFEGDTSLIDFQDGEYHLYVRPKVLLNDTFDVYGVTLGYVCTIIINIPPLTLEGISFNEGSLNGNGELLMCNERDVYHSLDYIGFPYSRSSLIYKGIDSSTVLFVNGNPQVTKDLSELDLKSGDSIFIMRLPKEGNVNCNAFYLDTLYSDTVPVIVNDNTVEFEIYNRTINDTICPGGVITLNDDDLSIGNKQWYKNNESIGYKDSLLVFAPGKYFKYLGTDYDTKCFRGSNIIEIIEGANCSENYFVSGKVFLYYTDKVISNVLITTNTGLITMSDEKGEFRFEVPPSARFDTLIINQKGYNEKKYVVEFPIDFPSVGGIELRLIPTDFKDLVLSFRSGINRPGFTIPYYLNISNRGTTNLTTDVSVVLDNYLTFVEGRGEDLPDQVISNELIWKDITVLSGTIKRVYFYAELDRLTELGTILSSTGELNQLSLDYVPSNDTVIYESLVTGSYDPNDKLVSYIGAFTEGYVYDTTQFEYTIRFQNTGTDTAFNISVVDLMPEALDLSSIFIIDASHDYLMSISGDTVTWLFKNVLLPDSNVNEPASHGFIRFSINQEKGNQPGTTIANKAEIYFDFNDPIITNEVVSVVNNDIVTGFKTNPKVIANNQLQVYPTPALNTINITQEGTVVIYDQLGSRVLTSTNNKDIDVSGLSNGVYFIQVTTATEQLSGSFIKQ